jgi:hypothetical protein
MAINYNTKIITTTPYTITTDDEVLLSSVATASSIVLPVLNSGKKGSSYYIKDYSGNSKVRPITITAPPGKTIDGATFAILNTPYSRVLVVFDGINWYSIAG